MQKLIIRYYLIQLAVGFVLTALTINVIGFLNQVDEHSQSKLLLLSIVGATLYTILNVVINALNLTFPKKSDEKIAFTWPIVLWFLILAFAIGRLIIDNSTQPSDWFLIIIWAEPVYYNLKLKKAAANII